MSTTSRGNGFEVLIAKQLERSGWVCGSRRHISGGGDILAMHSDGRVWLIECKTTARGAFADFLPAQRREMKDALRRLESGSERVTGWLVHRGAPKQPVRWIPESGWPVTKEA